MRTSRPLCSALVLALTAWLSPSESLSAQSADTRSLPGRAPRVAIVLSGGGAKGMAHIGVLQVLEAAGISPDIVTGTSMGALVGGLYAIGYSPADLDTLVRRLDWPTYFSDASNYRFLGIDRRLAGDRTLLNVPMTRWRPSLPSGAISGQRISQLLSTLTWPVQATRDFRKFPRTFAAVATDIETGHAAVLDSGSLALALRASMSLPSIFEPVTLNGRLLVDGGVARNLPATEARALGATIVICSDVADPLAKADQLRSLADVLVQTIAFQMTASTREQQQLCDVNIRPDITGLTATNFDKPGDMIARGVSAAESVRDALAALGIARRSPADTVRRHVGTGSVLVRRVVIEGLTGRAALRAKRALELADGTALTAAMLDSAVQRAYATELYERVQYRLDADGADTIAVVTATTRNQDRAGIGLRFDDTYKASFLFSALIRNWIGSGSTTEIELRLGEQVRLAAEHISTSVQNPRYAFGGGASLVRAPLPVYIGGQRTAEVSLSVATMRVFAAATIGRRGGLAVELTSEASEASTVISVSDSTRRDQFGSMAVAFAWDALDRPVYPRRGVAIYARSEYAAGNTRFSQHVVRAQAAQPIRPGWTLLVDGTIGGATRGDVLPLHRYFQLGGAYPSVIFPGRQVGFVGLRHIEELGTSVVRAGVGVQWEPRRDIFATLRTNTGYAGELLTLESRRYHTGAGVSLGSLTPFGQIEITASAQNRRGGTRLEMNLGRMF